MTSEVTVLEQGEPLPETRGVIVWTLRGRIVSIERRFSPLDRPEDKLTAGESVNHVVLLPDCSLIDALNVLAGCDADIVLVSEQVGATNGQHVIGIVTPYEWTGAMKALAKLQ